MNDELEKAHPLPQPLMRQPDRQGFTIHFTGGFRASEIAENKWLIEPVLIDGQAQQDGYLPRPVLDRLTKSFAFRAIAFNNFGWHKGDFHSSWTPIVPTRANHSHAPSNLWGNMANNLGSDRTSDGFDAMTRAGNINAEDVAQLVDNRGDTERLCSSIKLSLRSMDIGVEQIVHFYNDQLVNMLSKKDMETIKTRSSLDQNLYANVHSFFLHFGASRDYLASLISVRLGGNMKKIDSMANLVKNMRQRHVDADPLLKMLIDRGDIVSNNEKGRPPFKTAGWLKSANDLRNQFTHRRPYGQKHLEKSGQVLPADRNGRFFKYHRPYVDDDGNVADILELVHHHYGQSCKLFLEMAEASGYDTKMMHFTDKDIISLEQN